MYPAPCSLLLVTLLFPSAQAGKPNLIKPINLTVNTKADEDDPHITSDGRRLYYSCNAEGKFDIFSSVRGSTKEAWKPGKLMDDTSVIRTKVDDRSVFVTTEGKSPQFIYFATKKDKDPSASFDIYVAVKVIPGPDKVFTESRALININTPDDEMHPWLTADGKSLYFSRKTKEGWRVCMASRKEAGIPDGFGEPITLDLPPDFHHPSLTPDGKTMYLQGPLEKGRWGLFVSTRTAKGWSMPEPLVNLNHPEAPTGDRSPCLSRDGTLLYFASDRPEGKGGLDLYVIPTIQLKKGK